MAGARPSLRAGKGSLAAGGRRLLRLPHQAWALAVCALALLLGVAVADDYGVWGDTSTQRAIGEATLRHVAGESGLNLLGPPDRLYGPIFETLLALVERIPDHADSRGVYLSRYLLTHLFFVAAGFAGYLLAHRLFGSRWLALFALLLFLLHPRIYAHSFFNSKDAPFLGLFMICLWLAHRAFGKGTGKGSAGAFALCGVAAGLLTNLRIMGLAFVAVVVVMRVCDVVAANGSDERRRAGAGCALFALASVAAFYAAMPYLWADPVVRFVEIVTVMSSHPTDMPQLFQGEWRPGSELPPSYLPVWFGVTTPPLALLLGAIGLASLVWRAAAGAANPKRGFPLRNTPLRFELLVAACFVAPLLAAIALRPTLYDDWRHFHFLWGPFVLLATSGLGTLTKRGASAGGGFMRPAVPTVAAGLATLGLGAIAVEMARLHPHQHLYFNVLADRPGAALPLRQRFLVVDWFGKSRAYAYILEELADRERNPDAVFNVRSRDSRTPPPLDIDRLGMSMGLFRPRDRRRFKFDRNADPDFYVRGGGERGELVGRRSASGRPSTVAPGIRFHGRVVPSRRSSSGRLSTVAPVLYEIGLYGQPIAQVATPDLSRVDAATADAYRTLYRDVTSGAPALGGDIDVYRSEAAITWVKEACAPGELNDTMRMTVVSSAGRRPSPRLHLAEDAVRVGSACLWQAALPDRPVAKIVFHGIGSLASDAYLEERRRRYAKLAATRPAARSTFDVYLEDGTLSYVKTPCAAADAEAPFFAHVRPVHPSAIPRSRHRQLGLDPLNFRFGSAARRSLYVLGDIFDGVCLATLDLPDYSIASIATGQYAPSGASLWRVEVGARAAARLEERRRRYAALSATRPAARSTFDVYLEDGALSYVKTPCAAADTEAPFFVHVRPERLDDLPSSRRQHGFDALDFLFGSVDPHGRLAAGDLFDDVCLATLDLPDYPVAGVATGQHARDGASIWRVDIGGG